MELLANVIADFWGHWIFPVAQFVIGLGLVVFVHELGHFLAAKWVGIKVERFALGFGPRLFGFTKGDTDYCVKLLPLGGYIKMLGQEDFAPLKDEEPDPRSYNAKTVGQRLFVISAGVIMNVILAAILFIIVGLVGKDFNAPIIGTVRANYPADTVELTWTPGGCPAGKACQSATTQPAATTQPMATTQPVFGPGLEPGDRVIELDGDCVTRFQRLQMASALTSGKDEIFEIAVERIGPDGQKWTGRGRMGVQKDPTGNQFVFGVTPASTTIIGRADYALDTPFQKGDRIVSVNGTPVTHSWQIDQIAETLDGTPVEMTVLRDDKEVKVNVRPQLWTKEAIVWLKDGQRAELLRVAMDESGKPAAFVRMADGAEKEVPEDDLAGGSLIESLDILGMTPRLQADGVFPGSPADVAGVQPGDVILSYGDHPAPTHKQFTEISDKLADTSVPLSLLRDGQAVTVEVRPKTRKDGAQVGLFMAPDLASATIAGIREGSPAAAAGLANGDAIEQINGREVTGWFDVYNALKDLAGQEITLTYRRGAQQHTAELGMLNSDVFSADDYEISLLKLEPLKPLMVTIRKTNPLAAIAWGAGETWNFILSTYGTLRALATGTVSTKTLSGPVGIGSMAVQVGREQPTIDFVYFMAFISATLAVINFLPLPVVDGGHAVFLIIEKVRGKPLPVMVMNVVQFIGLAMLGLVFILLTWQDIARWFENLW